MNPATTNQRPVWHVGLGFLIASFLFALLVLAVRHSVCAPAIDADRAAERARDLAQIRAAEVQALNHPGWIDRQRGVVRLPIDVAMNLVAQEWQNPAVARTNLIAREEKATAPAPVAPAQPNAFE
ncbi:MAG TPA: hypothetical protein VG077_04145 [Verrucomicrobiae bacterium]|nr:hypothetical protein [Verrucomicrobiae bacterium]